MVRTGEAAWGGLHGKCSCGQVTFGFSGSGGHQDAVPRPRVSVSSHPEPSVGQRQLVAVSHIVSHAGSQQSGCVLQERSYGVHGNPEIPSVTMATGRGVRASPAMLSGWRGLHSNRLRTVVTGHTAAPQGAVPAGPGGG